MEPNETLAQDDVRHDDGGRAPETKGVRRPGSPAIITRRASSIAALSRTVQSQSRAIKAISSADARRRLAEAKGRATHELRASVNQQERLARRGRSDVLIAHKLDRINGDINRIEASQRADRLARQNASLRAENVKLRRPRAPLLATRGAAGGGVHAARALYRKAALQYLRTGQETLNGQHISTLQRKAGLHTGSQPDGGFLVHPEHDTGPLEKLLLDAVVMRQIATVRPISGSSLKKPVNTRGTDAQWVGEQQDRNETETPDLVELDFPAMELYAQPKASQTMLEDAFMDIEAWLAEEVADAFAQKEELAFISGDGINKPKGLLAYNLVANGSWSWGKIGYVATGVDGGFAAPGSTVNQGDKLVDVVYALKAGHRTNAQWLMNSATAGKVRQLKDGEGRWIWSDARDDMEPLLLGKPVQICERMPDMGTNSHSIAFGDFAKGYLIVDRVGVTVLRDPYTAKPYVMFYTRKRVGGGVQNFEAFKTLKFGTS